MFLFFCFGRENSVEEDLIELVVKSVLAQVSNTPEKVGEYSVGLESRVQDLMNLINLKPSCDDVQILGLYRMGGIGKTTLARKVYNHRTIKSHFPRLAWVCVSQQFTKKDVWQTILQQLRPEIKVLEMTEYVLQEKLSEVLETQKALIVIDDIWREGDWDRIKYVFLQKKGESLYVTYVRLLKVHDFCYIHSSF